MAAPSPAHHNATQRTSPSNTSAESTIASQVNNALKSCHARARLALELGAEDRQETGRQRTFAKDAPQQIGDAKGDDEGVHDAPFAQAQQRGGGHVAHEPQHAAG